MRCRVALAIAVVLGFASVVRADPADLKQIAADAKWGAHLDADALMASTLAKKAHEQMLKEHPEAAAHMAAFRKMWNFEPAKDLHGITIYGWQLKKDTGVAIVHAKVDQKLLLEKAKQAPEHRVMTYGKHELHSWLHAKGTPHERYLTGTFYKPDVLVFGASVEEVMKALDVLDGTKPNVAATNPAMAASIPQGTILAAGLSSPGDAKLPCPCPLAKQVDLLQVAIGEYQGQVFVGGKLTAKTATTAQQMKTVAEGALAFASLMHSDDAGLTKLISAVKLAVADKTVDFEWSGPVDVAWRHLQKAIAKCKAMHKDWGHQGMPPVCPLQKDGCPLQKKK